MGKPGQVQLISHGNLSASVVPSPWGIGSMQFAGGVVAGGWGNLLVGLGFTLGA